MDILDTGLRLRYTRINGWSMGISIRHTRIDGVNTGITIRNTRFRDCESIFVGEALALNPKLK